MHIFFVKMYILHLFEKTSPPFILYLDFTVRITGPLKVPEDSVCFHGACFRNQLTSSKKVSKLSVFVITAFYSYMYHYYNSNDYNYSLCNVKPKNSFISIRYVSCLCYAYEYLNSVIKNVNTRVHVFVTS